MVGCFSISVRLHDGIRVLEYGTVEDEESAMAEVSQNDPVACSIDACCILPGTKNRTTGVFDYRCEGHTSSFARRLGNSGEGFRCGEEK